MCWLGPYGVKTVDAFLSSEPKSMRPGMMWFSGPDASPLCCFLLLSRILAERLGRSGGFCACSVFSWQTQIAVCAGVPLFFGTSMMRTQVQCIRGQASGALNSAWQHDHHFVRRKASAQFLLCVVVRPCLGQREWLCWMSCMGEPGNGASPSPYCQIRTWVPLSRDNVTRIE